MSKTRKLTLMAIFIALAFVGALIKIPSPIGTVGFDSTAGYLSVLYIGYLPGATVTALGYLLIAASAGFPLGLLTIVVAIEMFLIAMAYKYFYEINVVLGLSISTILNGVIAPLIVLPLGGWGLYVGLIPSLTVASFANLIASSAIYEALRKVIPPHLLPRKILRHFPEHLRQHQR